MTNRLHSPIFIVGPSRGGTTMATTLLSRHPLVNISSETHYFDDLRTQFDEPAHRILTDKEERDCQDYFLALTHRPYGHGGDAHKGWMAREDLAHRAKLLGRTPDAYFEAFLQLESRNPDKEIFGEKTPRHVFRIDEILMRYPDARIVAMLRDPRAVVASYRDWENRGGFDFDADPGHELALEQEQRRVERSYHPLVLAGLWRGQTNAMLTAHERFGRTKVRLLKYEDLVVNPELEAQRLTDWLGINFHPDMLNVPMSNSSVEAFSEDVGVSTHAMDRWRTRLSTTEISLVESVASKTMRTVGYPLLGLDAGVLGRAKSWATLPSASYRALMANRDRVERPSRYVLRRLRAIAQR